MWSEISMPFLSCLFIIVVVYMLVDHMLYTNKYEG